MKRLPSDEFGARISKIYVAADCCAEFQRKETKKKKNTTTLVTSERMLERGRPRHSKRKRTNERTSERTNARRKSRGRETKRKFKEDKLFEIKIRPCWLERPCSRLRILELFSLSAGFSFLSTEASGPQQPAHHSPACPAIHDRPSLIRGNVQRWPAIIRW